MDQDAKALLNTVEETMKLPRENGELIFHTPWESRIFAMAVLLSEKGIYPWKTFNGEFSHEVGEAEQNHPETDVVSVYYQLWSQAFEKLLLDQNVLSREQLESRIEEFASGKRHHVC
jgi:nitrile hydratase accessory protein